MFKLSDNYNLRKFYFQNDQVPTQSIIRDKMSPELASVFFKSMAPNLKVLAGLEPQMKGGGSDWFVCPKAVLGGRAVMKPLDNKYLTKINHHGVIHLGIKSLQVHHREILAEKNQMLRDSDNNWKNTVTSASDKHWKETTAKHKQLNTEYIQDVFDSFSVVYRTSLNKFEDLLSDAALKEINKIQREADVLMQHRYENALKAQSTMLNDRYAKKLIREKKRLKTEFDKDTDKIYANTANTIHDVNVEKRVAIENSKKFFEYQNLACQIYVALKERENCMKDMETSKHKHKKKVKTLTDDIIFKDLTINLAEKKEEKHLELYKLRQAKICKLIKNLQMFVSYCLRTLPGHAEFFINMEKLMLLQISEALENPNTESIIEEDQPLHTPVPRALPFYLFCDRGYKPAVDQDLCPKHCASSASQLPVIIVNKRCMYAACDNFDQFTNKINEYIHGNRGDDADIKDDLNYEHFVPVKYTEAQRLRELKLESSILQILQQEMSNTKIPFQCDVCKMPCCFCSSQDTKKSSQETNRDEPIRQTAGSSKMLGHEREPKWESYFKYVEPKKCTCDKMAKKHLMDNLPAYMRNTSKYQAPVLPNYQTCSVATLKHMVKKARGQVDYVPIPKIVSLTKDIGTQCTDQEFDWLCNCFADSELDLWYKDMTIGSTIFGSGKPDDHILRIADSLSSSYLQQKSSSFATDRAYSLRQLIDSSPELVEIFKKKKC